MNETEKVRAIQNTIGEPYREEGHVSLDALSERTPVAALGHSGMTTEQLEKLLRMQGVYAAMRSEDVAILQSRFLEQRTLQEIAEQEGVSPQAVDKRVRKAVQNFKRAFAAHWNDPIDWSILGAEDA